MIYSKIPFSATYRHIYSAGKLKSVGGVTINFNGRNINFMTTHFDPYTASYRLTQARDLVTYMKGFAENRIVAGDFNDQPGNPPITTMTAVVLRCVGRGEEGRRRLFTAGQSQRLHAQLADRLHLLLACRDRT